MTADRNAEYLAGLVRELCKLPHETEWVEFNRQGGVRDLFQLPAPLFETPEGFTRAVLFAHKSLAAMDKAHRIRACYLHACLRYVMRQPVTNTSIRERFGIEEKNSALASRLLNEAVDDGMIVVRDPSVGTKIRSYLPYWAAPGLADPGKLA